MQGIAFVVHSARTSVELLLNMHAYFLDSIAPCQGSMGKFEDVTCALISTLGKEQATAAITTNPVSSAGVLCRRTWGKPSYSMPYMGSTLQSCASHAGRGRPLV